MELQSILKMVSDENRLRIINLIKEDSLCVGEIQTILGIQQSNTSRHLEKLKYNQLIKYKRKGNSIFYSLNSDIFNQYSFLTDLLYQDSLKNQVFKDDMDKLKKYRESSYDCNDLKAVDFDFNKLSF